MNCLSINKDKEERNRCNELVGKCKEVNSYFDEAINRGLTFKNELEQAKEKHVNLVLEQN